MRIGAQRLCLIAILPFLYESLDHTLPTVSFGPFTIGRWVLVLVGMILLQLNRKQVHKSMVFNGYGILLLGTFISSLIIGDLESITRSIAFMMLLFGAKGLAVFLNTGIGRNSILLFFLVCLAYWANYTLTNIFSGGKINAYSELFVEGEVLNHHFVGIIASVSGLITGVILFYRNQNLKIWGYIWILFSVVICFLSESRSNTIFSILGLILVLMVQEKKVGKQILVLIPVLLIAYLFLDNLTTKSDSLYQRYDFSDTDYQTRTTSMRFDMIYIAIDDFISNPMGKGFRNVYIRVGTRDLNIHNQFLSYIIGGGIISLIGTIIWLMGIYKSMKFLITRKAAKLKDNQFIIGITIGVTIFHITLFTIEYSSLMFFVILSLAFVAESACNDQKKQNLAGLKQN